MADERDDDRLEELAGCRFTFWADAAEPGAAERFPGDLLTEADAMADELALGRVRSIVVEGEEETYLVERAADGRALVVGLKSPAPLGRVRHLAGGLTGRGRD